jgi:hypothetical protein
MFLPINTFNIDEKFDYEFDHNLQFHPIAPPHSPTKKKNRKKNCTNFTCFAIRWKLLQIMTKITSGGKEAWHNYGTQKISL